MGPLVVLCGQDVGCGGHGVALPGLTLFLPGAGLLLRWGLSILRIVGGATSVSTFRWRRQTRSRSRKMK
ncbi:hypothetical protein XELAEV_18011261mg [Xenopus laevis]|uniref:Uncharacterized protein n=1 Tax=Xenopus laevis TaxID=8355 RepID=A0A974DLY4_XENLA|nr:hypothetical protein XELAEV_18011261mg [Xenopus laevis]